MIPPVRDCPLCPAIKMFYWPCLFGQDGWIFDFVLFCVFMDSTPFRSINTQKKNLVNIQPSWTHSCILYKNFSNTGELVQLVESLEFCILSMKKNMNACSCLQFLEFCNCKFRTYVYMTNKSSVFLFLNWKWTVDQAPWTQMENWCGADQSA